jgi:hypothetical protein
LWYVVYKSKSALADIKPENADEATGIRILVESPFTNYQKCRLEGLFGGAENAQHIPTTFLSRYGLSIPTKF